MGNNVNPYVESIGDEWTFAHTYSKHAFPKPCSNHRDLFAEVCDEVSVLKFLYF